MESRTFIIVSVTVLFAATANCYPEGGISDENSKPAIVDNEVNVIIAENSTTGKYDWTEKWEPPARLKPWFPYHIIGKDEDGASRTDEEIQAIDKYLDQVIDRFSRDAEANDGDGGVVIFDWDGFELLNYAHSEAARLALKQFTSIGRVHAAVKKAFAVNVNFAADLFLNSSRPFMGSFFEKLERYGTQRNKWISQLLRHIPQNVLPKAYGGTGEF